MNEKEYRKRLRQLEYGTLLFALLSFFLWLIPAFRWFVLVYLASVNIDRFLLDMSLVFLVLCSVGIGVRIMANPDYETRREWKKAKKKQEGKE